MWPCGAVEPKPRTRGARVAKGLIERELPRCTIQLQHPDATFGSWAPVRSRRRCGRRRWPARAAAAGRRTRPTTPNARPLGRECLARIPGGPWRSTAARSGRSPPTSHIRVPPARGPSPASNLRGAWSLADRWLTSDCSSQQFRGCSLRALGCTCLQGNHGRSPSLPYISVLASESILHSRGCRRWIRRFVHPPVRLQSRYAGAAALCA